MKVNRIFKKALLFALSLVLLLSAVSFATGLFGVQALAATSESNPLTFVVPEAIYLYPDGLSWKQAVSTPFQYYINNNSNGTVTKDTKDTTGKIYYSLSGAGNATISYQFLNTSLSSMSGGSVTLSSSTISNGGSVNITAGTSPSLATNVSGCYIRWTLSYTDPKDGASEKAYAYTYVYKPYTVPVGGFNRVENTDGTSHYAQSMSWLVGMQGYQTRESFHDDGGYYPKYKTDRGLAPFASENNVAYIGGTRITSATVPSISPNISNDNETFMSGAARWYTLFTGTGTDTVHFQVTDFNNKGPTGWGSTSSNDNTYNVKTFDYWYKNQDAYNVLSVLHSAAQGVLTVDTSRYTDLQYIPNLSIGLMATDDEHSEWDFWYVSDYSGGSSTYITTGSYDGSDARGNFYGARNYIIAGQGTNGATDSHDYADEGVKYAGPWPRTLQATSGSYTYVMHGFFGTEEDSTGTNDWAFNHCFIDLVTTHYNKANLRTAVQNAIKHFPLLNVNGISGSSITSRTLSSNSKWSTFATAFTNAYKALTQVDGTITDPDTLAANLNNALTAVLVEDAPALSLNTEVNPNITISHDAKYYTFTPSESGNYVFFSYSTASVDSRIWVYEKNTSNANLLGEQKGYNDDYGHLTNGSKIKDLLGSYNNQSYTGAVSLTAGTTYVVKTNRYFSDVEIQGFADSSSYTGTWPLKVCKAVNITFNATGGSSTFTVAMPVGHTMKMNKSGITRTDHTLIAWSTSGSQMQAKHCMASETKTIPSSATSYYALWNPTSPTVVSVDNDYTVSIDADYQVQYFSFTPSETRRYYIHSTNSSNEPDPYAVLSKASDWASGATYITYNDDGDGNRQFAITDTELTAGTTYLIGAKLYNNGTGSYPFRIERMYKITFNDNGGSGGPGAQYKYYNATYTFSSAAPSRNGYTFKGWSTSSTATSATYVEGSTYTTNADLTVYAVWEANKYNLTLNKNGGSGGTDSVTATFDAAMPALASVPTKSGYTFAGYYDTSAATGGTKYYNANRSSAHTWDKYANTTESNTLYARWDPNVTLSTGTGYTVSQQPASSVAYNGSTTFKITLTDAYSNSGVPTATATGGATVTSSKSGNVITYTVSGITATANITVGNATINSYAVTFNKNGTGYTNTAPAATVNHGGSVSFTVTLSTGYTNSPNPTVTATNGTVSATKSGNTITYTVSGITAATTINVGAATINKYTVTFKAENGTVLKTEEVNHGASATPPAAQTKAPDDTNHYTFNGWSGYTNITENKTITASFTAVAHTFKFVSHDVLPTCTEPGSDTYKCDGCVKTKTVTVDALGHAMTFNAAVAGTDCQHNGTVAYYHCSRCEKDFEEEAGITELTSLDDNTPGEHDYTAATVKDEALKSEATCTSAAVYYYSCSVCGAVESDDSHTFTDGDPIAHDYTAAVVKDAALKSEATCTSAAVYYYSCSVCGAVESNDEHTFTDGDPIEHDYTAAVVK
ncbi:MAG: InlB B-repeat-containing protein, partial [Clostridia bacterium]|nr:InlB B-repeat-containing protein [Clostridia bacterium]